jgi:60 kDa SS-A/Ro ribonucleoprotein
VDHLADISTRHTPQREQADARQVENAEGGYVFQLDPIGRLHRFLTLGVDRPTYYAHTDQAMRELARENAQVVIDYAQRDAPALVEAILSVSEAGRAPRQQPCIFALAVAASLADEQGRKLALIALPRVCRTGYHLFTFARYVRQFRGWGRGLRRAVGAWYAARDIVDLADEGIVYGSSENDVSELAYQVAKYRQRDGFTHRDLLRLSHGHWHIRSALSPHWTLGEDQRALFEWICGRESPIDRHESLERIVGLQLTKQAPLREVPALVRRYGLTWEMLPDAALLDPKVWHALLDVGVPQTALLRQLPRLTRIGLFDRGPNDRTIQVMEQLVDGLRTRKARIHPVQVLTAMRTYSRGHSTKGKSTWTPAGRVVDALDEMFYVSFGSIEPTGKRLMLAVDSSGSMSMTDFTPGHRKLYDDTGLLPREIAAALLMATARVETDALITAFRGSRGSMDIAELAITPRQRLDDVIRYLEAQPFGGTDCSLPMRWAEAKQIPVDAFIVYTDNETWAGPVHAHQALQRYRDVMGIPARLVVVGMTATGFTIANPSDPLSLDVAGFDSAVPRLISDFARGNL